jgi:hypothetical protein
MSEMIYQWRPGLSQPVEAQIAGEHLERIRIRNNGYLSPRAIVDDAKSEESPLHPAFEWDDTVAAQRHREQQARTIIGSIIAVIPERSKETAPVRAFVSITKEGQKSYTSIAQAMSDEELRAQVVAQAWRELQSWRKRYAEIKELGDLFAALDKIEAPTEE